MPGGRFLDTNILVYAASRDDGRTDRAQRLLSDGGTVSIQVLNEFASVASRKLGSSWAEIRGFLADVRPALRIVTLGEADHRLAIDLAERYRLAFHDASIIAAALRAGCDTLLTEDMHAGLVVDGRLTVIDPFA